MTQQTEGAVLTAEDVLDRLSLMSVSTTCDLHPLEARQWLEAVRQVVRQRNDATAYAEALRERARDRR
jgi:hypothetical protein